MLKFKVEDHLAKWPPETGTLLLRISCTDLLLCLAFWYLFFSLWTCNTVVKMKRGTLGKRK